MKVVLLAGAEQDLRELRSYLIKKFGKQTWQSAYRHIQTTIRSLGDHPLGGSIPDELIELQLGPYRQVISGMNRIIYEVGDDIVFVHVICDTKRQLSSVLARRLLRPE